MDDVKAVGLNHWRVEDAGMRVEFMMCRAKDARSSAVE